MNDKKKLIAAGLLLVLVGVLISRGGKEEPEQDSNQHKLDSMENVLNQLRIANDAEHAKLTTMLDSVDKLNAVIETKQSNYLKLKNQNEKLQKERATLVRGFSDADIERYLSRRYGNKD